MATNCFKLNIKDIYGSIEYDHGFAEKVKFLCFIICLTSAWHIFLITTLRALNFILFNRTAVCLLNNVKVIMCNALYG